MASWAPLSLGEQFALHLRKELIRGNWGGKLPGIHHLAGEFGVNHKTVRAAVRLLEEEGILVDQGPGRERRVVIPRGEISPLRIAILTRTRGLRKDLNTTHCMQALSEHGHTPFFAARTEIDLAGEPSRLRRLLKQTEADAWLVHAGSRELLTWFSAQPVPTFALFGRREGLPLAAVGPDMQSALVEATRHLIELGHRRIIMLAREERRVPSPGASERAILDELEANGIPTGEYNLPHWEDSGEGLSKILTLLFEISPPTSLLIDRPSVFNAVLQIVLQKGFRVPQDVSLICSDWASGFEMCQPTIAHIDWDVRPVGRRVAQWANNVSRGRRDVRQSFTRAKYVEGGTVGPAPE